jgi:hypothetical protein
MPLYVVLRVTGPFLSEASAYAWILRNGRPEDQKQYQVLEMALPRRDSLSAPPDEEA